MFNSCSSCFHSQVHRLQVSATSVVFIHLFFRMYYFKLCRCVWVCAHECWCLQRSEMLDSPWNYSYSYEPLYMGPGNWILILCKNSVGSFLTCWTISLAHKYLFLFLCMCKFLQVCLCDMCAWCPPRADHGVGSLETRVTDVYEPLCGCWEQHGPIQEQWVSLSTELPL